MGRYSRFAVYGASERMCSATVTWPSFRSDLAFASKACTSAADENVFTTDASACGAGDWGSAVDSADAAAGAAAGFPAITNAAAMSASTRLNPRVRIRTSPLQDFYFFTFRLGTLIHPRAAPMNSK